MVNSEERTGSNPEQIGTKFDLKQVIIIGIAATGATIFGYFQLSFFSTYVDHVLGEEPIAIAIMKTISFPLIFIT